LVLLGLAISLASANEEKKKANAKKYVDGIVEKNFNKFLIFCYHSYDTWIKYALLATGIDERTISVNTLRTFDGDVYDQRSRYVYEYLKEVSEKPATDQDPFYFFLNKEYVRTYDILTMQRDGTLRDYLSKRFQLKEMDIKVQEEDKEQKRKEIGRKVGKLISQNQVIVFAFHCIYNSEANIIRAALDAAGLDENLVKCVSLNEYYFNYLNEQFTYGDYEYYEEYLKRRTQQEQVKGPADPFVFIDRNYIPNQEIKTMQENGNYEQLEKLLYDANALTDEAEKSYLKKMSNNFPSNY